MQLIKVGSVEVLCPKFDFLGKYILLQRGIPNEVNELIAKYAHSTSKKTE